MKLPHHIDENNFVILSLNHVIPNEVKGSVTPSNLQSSGRLIRNTQEFLVALFLGMTGLGHF